VSLPTHAEIVIVGGGIAGCSTAYHLAKMGKTDVLLLEQGKLTSGTTWHAAGLIGQMRPNRNMTVMSKYGIELYASLEAETGLATGWKQCGSVNVAKTPERMKVLKKQTAMANAWGVECHLISPKEAGDRYPVMRTDDLQGAIWLPGDGKANPADLCMSLAKGARNRGVKMVEGVEVTGVIIENGKAVGVKTVQGDVRCEVLVNCAGQWARQFGKLAGVNVPLYPAEHFYIVSGKIEGVHPMLPRRLHLLQGRSGRPADGWLRTSGQAVAGGPDSVHLPVSAAGRRLGSIRTADDRSHPPYAVPGNGRDQDAAQRPRELHAGWQLHSG
jgi:glycine/D-amino acid oxidase-like deaminating enzyme